MFRCYSYTVIRERINLCLLKLQMLNSVITVFDTPLFITDLIYAVKPPPY